MSTSGRVAVVGLGYIGLPTAAALADHGAQVIGVDVNAATVEAVSRAEVPFVEPDLAEAVERRRRHPGPAHRLDGDPAGRRLHRRRAHAVPRGPLRRPVVRRAAAEQIAPPLRGGEIVILESTSPPGHHRDGQRAGSPELRPDLGLAGTADGPCPTSHVAHCPERVLPGRIMIEIVTNDRVVGGLTPRVRRAGGAGLPDLLPGRAACSPTPRTRRDGQARRERLPRRQHRLRQRAVADRATTSASTSGRSSSSPTTTRASTSCARAPASAGTASRSTRGSSSAPPRSAPGSSAPPARSTTPSRTHVVDAGRRARRPARSRARRPRRLPRARLQGRRRRPAREPGRRRRRRDRRRARPTATILAVEPYVDALPAPLAQPSQRPPRRRLSEALAAADVVVLLVDHDGLRRR